jgi:hypothetical protein
VGHSLEPNWRQTTGLTLILPQKCFSLLRIMLYLLTKEIGQHRAVQSRDVHELENA